MNRPIRKLPILAAVGALALAGAAHAASICRWVDENGRTQISDAVPEKYRPSAKCTDSGAYELSPAETKRAQERAAQEKAQSDRNARPGAVASGPVAASSAPPAKRPVQGVSDATDCETWRRLYEESQECFGPYRTTRGTTKAEAFDKCNVIPSPELKCGPPRR